jgi:hypothetical protein
VPPGAVPSIPEHPLFDVATILSARVGGEVYVSVDQTRDES